MERVEEEEEQQQHDVDGCVELGEERSLKRVGSTFFFSSSSSSSFCVGVRLLLLMTKIVKKMKMKMILTIYRILPLLYLLHVYNMHTNLMYALLFLLVDTHVASRFVLLQNYYAVGG